jgi:hypothetical protein|tara:strand:+ start:586 stop:2295 length:1710 start_codon:yes stop_codon:yes gene_type:complete
MTNTPNPHYITQNSNGSGLTQPVDSVDFPHSGLFKALNQMANGNVVLKTGADFDINQTGGNLVVSAGKILRNGEYRSVSGKSFADSSLTTSYTKGYHLLVVADGREGGETIDNLYLRPPTANERVPEFKLGDTIVAIIEYSTSTSAGSRLIQFFTTNKESNSLSIAYANSNVYTHAMAVTADSDGDVTFENVAQDKDVIFKVNDGGTPTEVMRIDGGNSRVGIGTDSPSSVLHVQGASNPTIRVQETGQTGHAELTAVVDSQTRLKAINNTSSEPITFDISPVCTSSGSDQILRIFRDSDAAVDGNFRINRVGTTTSILHVYSDKDGTAHTLTMDGKTALGATSIGTNTMLSVDGAISLKEQASADADTATYGQLWTKTGAGSDPNELYFTNEAGNDIQITSGSSLASSSSAQIFCRWGDIGGELTDDKATNILINNWTYTEGDTGLRDAMSSGVFTCTAALAGTYIISPRIMFKNGTLSDTAGTKYQIQNILYYNAGGGTPSSGTLHGFTRVINADFYADEVLEGNYLLTLSDGDTFGIYGKIGCSTSGTVKITDTNGFTNLYMYKIA